MELISQTSAKEAGKIRFFTGRPCKRGHLVERMVVDGLCIECKKIHTFAWRKDNKHKVDAAKKAWIAENRERSRLVKNTWNAQHKEAQKIRSRRWYEMNKEKSLESHYRWADRNPATVTAAAARYRASELQRTPPWADKNMIEVIYKLAKVMSEITGVEYQVDHIHPLQGKTVSGLHVETNLQILSALENKSKSNRQVVFNH